MQESGESDKPSGNFFFSDYYEDSAFTDTVERFGLHFMVGVTQGGVYGLISSAGWINLVGEANENDACRVL